jgi:hypothetical protein
MAINPEKSNESSGGGEETQEQAETSRQLHQIAKEEEHRHEHEEAHKQQEETELKKIEERAGLIGGKVAERVKILLKEAEEFGMITLPSSGELVDVLNNQEIRNKYYDGWSSAEINELYEVLHGVDMSGNFSFDEVQQIKLEAAQRKKEYDEWRKAKEVEDARKLLEQQEQEKKYKEQQEQKNRELEKGLQAEEEERARRIKENRWFGLGRFFPRGK